MRINVKNNSSSSGTWYTGSVSGVTFKSMPANANIYASLGHAAWSYETSSSTFITIQDLDKTLLVTSGGADDTELNLAASNIRADFEVTVYTDRDVELFRITGTGS